MLVFDKNILITAEKTYYYELIGSTVDDITVFRNPKKLQFLEEIGFTLNQDPELSLKAFMSLKTLAEINPKFSINGS